MIKMIDRFTGTEFWCADNRVDDYLGLGHSLAPDPDKKPVKVPMKKEPAEAPKKRGK